MEPFEPVRIDTKDAPEPEMVTLFYIDEKAYQIPKSIRPNIAVAFLRDLAEFGYDISISRAMVRAMGQEAMDALASCDAVGDKQMSTIMEIVRNQLFNKLEDTRGKSESG